MAGASCRVRRASETRSTRIDHDMMWEERSLVNA
jgi:hypothetical protein